LITKSTLAGNKKTDFCNVYPLPKDIICWGKYTIALAVIELLVSFVIDGLFTKF